MLATTSGLGLGDPAAACRAMAGVGVVTAGGMVVGRAGARSTVIPVATMVSGGALVPGLARLTVAGPSARLSIVGRSMATLGLARSVVVGRLALVSRATAAAAGRRFLYRHHGEGHRDSARGMGDEIWGKGIGYFIDNSRREAEDGKGGGTVFQQPNGRGSARRAPPKAKWPKSHQRFSSAYQNQGSKMQTRQLRQ